MARLEDITVGCRISGITPREAVTVIAVQWYGTGVLEVTFKNPGNGRTEIDTARDVERC